MAPRDATLTETEHPPPPTRDKVVPGTRLGRYEIEAELGRGGMGVVYRARDDELGRRLAIKLLQSGGTDRARLLREARAVANLRHANIVTVYDVGSHGDEPFVAMELVDGTTLRAAIAGRGWREVIAAYAAAGSGLAAAHDAGIVHRDFKPDNVLVGGDGRVVVTDFGIASAVVGDPDGPVEVTVHGGTPAYMSPEQLRGEAVDARSDQFSFCVALYAALYGVRPFPVTGDVAALRRAVEAGEVAEPADRRGVPAAVEAAVRRGLDPDPARRHASMRELLAALVPRRRSRWWAAGIAGLAALGAVVAVTQRPRDPLAPIAAVAVPEPPAAEPPLLGLDHEPARISTRIAVPPGSPAVPPPRKAPPVTGSASETPAGSDAGSGYKGIRGEVMESYPGGVK